MDVLRTAVSALAFYDPDRESATPEANLRKSYRLTGQVASIVAATDRIRKGLSVIPPDPQLRHAANFIQMLTGTKPDATAERALDVALILHADHEFNASTFAARVTAATLSDVHSAVVSAIGALKGPLHGGANIEVMRMLIRNGGDSPKSSPSLEKHSLRRKKSADLVIASITRKILVRHTCARCPRISAGAPGTQSGLKCLASSKRSSSKRKN